MHELRRVGCILSGTSWVGGPHRASDNIYASAVCGNNPQATSLMDQSRTLDRHLLSLPLPLSRRRRCFLEAHKVQLVAVARFINDGSIVYGSTHACEFSNMIEI